MPYSGRHRSSIFEQFYRCYPVSFINKEHLENGDKIVMPPSALERLAYLDIEYPMLFQLSDTSDDRITHCGVMEFVADEGTVCLPNWMMEFMGLEEGELVRLKSASLVKGSYVKLQPHTKDLLDISNPKAVLETTLRSYSCLTTGGTIVIPYNNKKYYIDIVETKPSVAISIIETDCEVDFAPPLDYQELEKPKSSLPNTTTLEAKQELTEDIVKFTPFTGSARRLDSMLPVEPTSSPLAKPAQPDGQQGTHGYKSSSSASSANGPGKLVFGSNANHRSKGTPPNAPKISSQESTQDAEKPKFQAFTGKKYSLM